MSIIHLHHGSLMVVRVPSIDRCKPHNDYGRGFYCTRSLELAKEWACQQGHSGFANTYAIDMESLDVLDLNSGPFNILHWLTLLLQNRTIRLASPVMVQGDAWLKKHFSIDVSSADVIKGYRADDSYFGFARAFLRNEITLEQLSRAMRLGELGEQYMVKSPRAFDALDFVSCEPAQSAVYWAKRTARDDKARRDFRELASVQEHGELAKPALYISTLMTLEEDDLHACLR